MDHKSLGVTDAQMMNRWQHANEAYALYTGLDQQGIDVRHLWWQHNNFQEATDEWGSNPANNVIKSVIDTAASKLSQIKPSVKITPQNGGSWERRRETRKNALSVQRFVDFFFSQNKISSMINKGLLHKMIFGKAFYFVNPWLRKIHLLKDWECGLIDPEIEHGCMKHAQIRVDFFPVAALPEWLPIDEWGLQRRVAYLTRHAQQVNLIIWFDAIRKECVVFFDNEPVKTLKWDHDTCPVIYDYFYDPVVGTHSQSVVDILKGIQRQIDVLNRKITAVTKKISAVYGFVATESGMSKSQLSDEDVAIFETVGGAASVSLNSPTINLGWLQDEHRALEARAFDRIGISELSAMAQKPRELASGVSMQVYADIESTRFQYQVDLILELSVRIVNAIVEFFPEDAEVLRDNPWKIKWGDVKKAYSGMNLGFYPKDVLLDAPENRINKIMQYAQTVNLPQSKVVQMVQVASLDEVEDFITADYDSVNAFIEKYVSRDYGFFEIRLPSVIHKSVLETELLMLIIRLSATEDPTDMMVYRRANLVLSRLYDKYIEDGLIPVGVLPNEVPGLGQSEIDEMRAEQAPIAGKPPPEQAEFDFPSTY